MPALTDREKQEGALLLLLMQPFDNARRQAAAGAVNWTQFEADVQAALERQLAAVFVLAAAGMASSQSHTPSGSFGGLAWASGYSHSVARDVATASRERLAAGSDPESIFGRARAETIAVTETTSAVTRGEAEVAGDIETQTGDVLEPFWRTVGGGLVCPVCKPLHNTPRDVWGDDFPAGPPAHPNCRCHLNYKRLSQGLGL